MQELLLAFICLNGPGCAEGSRAYAEYNKQTVEAIEQAANRYKTGYEPFLICGATKVCILNLTDKVSIETGPEIISLKINLPL
jgi:hypothetical protein